MEVRRHTQRYILTFIMTSVNEQPRTVRETLLVAEVNRFVLFPIRFSEVSSVCTMENVANRVREIWEVYKTAQASFWTPAEIDFSNDREHWEALLTVEERQFLSTILAFFAASDGIVVENLATRFCAEIQVAEARCFYGYQIMM